MYKSIKELFTAIADVIRERLGIEGKIPTQDIPNRVLDLFFTGFTQGRETGEKTGYTQGLAEGIEQGKQAQYDEFWDSYQENGAKKRYEYSFAGTGWDDNTFKPKYDLILGLGYSGTSMFQLTGITDLSAALKKQGVKLDTTLCGWFGSMFMGSQLITKIPEINCTHAMDYDGGLQMTFYNATALQTIEKLIVFEDTTYHTTFTYCNSLENLNIEGVIGQNGFDVGWSKKLSKASIISIITHLSDSASGKSITISKTAVNNGFETSAGAADGSTSEEWVTLITAKSNWTINLIDA